MRAFFFFIQQKDNSAWHHAEMSGLVFTTALSFLSRSQKSCHTSNHHIRIPERRMEEGYHPHYKKKKFSPNPQKTFHYFSLAKLLLDYHLQQQVHAKQLQSCPNLCDSIVARETGKWAFLQRTWLLCIKSGFCQHERRSWPLENHWAVSQGKAWSG